MPEINSTNLKYDDASGVMQLANPNGLIVGGQVVTPGSSTSFNVKNYGAVGDGTTDDTTAIQAAVTAAGVNGVVLFPSGYTFIVSADILYLAGQSVYAYGATIKAKSGTTPNLANFSGTSTSLLKGFKVFGGTWDGNKNTDTIPAGGYTTATGIYAHWATDIEIADVVVQNCQSAGIEVGDSLVAHVRIRNVVCKNSNDNQIFIRPGCLDVIVADSIFYGSHYSGCQASRSDYVKFIGCQSFKNGPAISTEGDGFGFEGCRFSEMIGCTAWGNSQAGFKVDMTSEGNANNWQGAWAPTTTYTAGQAVSYQGLNWYCIQNTTAGIAPYDGNPYWAQSAYDGAGSNRFSANIVLTNCRAVNNFAQSSTGTYNNATSYALNQSVYYTRSFSDLATSNGSRTVTSAAGAQFTNNDVGMQITGSGIPSNTTITGVTNATTATMSQKATATASNVSATLGGIYVNKVACSGVVPTTTENWIPITQSSGFFVLRSDNVVLNDCEGSYNSGNGFQIAAGTGQYTTNITLNNPKAYSNGSRGIYNSDGQTSNGPLFINNMDVYGNMGNNVDLQISTTLRGGRASAAVGGQEGIAINGGSQFLFDGVELSDNTDNGILVSGSGSDTVIVTDCKFFNTSGNQARCIYQSNTSSTIIIDRCTMAAQGNQYFGNFQTTATVGNNNIYTANPGGMVSKSASYTALLSDFLILASGTTTITLPTAVGCAGKRFLVKNTDATHTVTVATTSAQTIDNATTVSLSVQNEALEVQSDNANWQVICQVATVTL